MWISPDGKIHKLVLIEGTWGNKPSEQSKCEILISNCPESFLEYNNTSVVIGDSDNYIRRTLDICLSTMNKQETAKFKLSPENLSFTLQLIRFDFKGYIYQWDAKKKLEMAQNHKDKGVALFKQNHTKDAAYRFRKALKIIHSIPINAEAPPKEIDSVPTREINNFKANLYNNLASYFLKREAWSLTIDTCKRVFEYDSESIKAHYKAAVAYKNERNFEEAEGELNVVLAAEPDNKAAIEHMKHVREEINKANKRVNEMVRKMFC